MRFKCWNMLPTKTYPKKLLKTLRVTYVWILVIYKEDDKKIAFKGCSKQLWLEIHWNLPERLWVIWDHLLCVFLPPASAALERLACIAPLPCSQEAVSLARGTSVPALECLSCLRCWTSVSRVGDKIQSCQKVLFWIRENVYFMENFSIPFLMET